MKSLLKKRCGPDGIHLFNRATGMNLLIDEVEVPMSMWAAAPRHVSVSLTNECDLNCPHCFAPKHTASLDSGILTSWLDELDGNGCLGVGFGGGEPTLFKDLPKLCGHASKSTGLAVTLTTNAHHLHDDLAADLKGNLHFIRVSIDGIGPTYEMLRGKPFSLLLNRLETVRDIAPFGINFLVNSTTFPDLNAATEFAADVGATEFLLLPEQAVNGLGGIDNRTTKLLSNWVNSYRGTVPLRISVAGADGLPTCNPLAQETELRSYAHIDASGVIKRSSFDEAGVIIGLGGVMQALKKLEEYRG
jgi:MoaA/NifB/PqqE/SkfB family radical SAM enzyme